MKLPTGAELFITVADFAVSKNLYQVILEELRAVKLDPKAEIDANFWKDMFCVMLASKKVDLALDECMKRCTYNKLVITADTWEPVERRDDYFTVCFEVAKENIQPFTKSLYAQYSHILESLIGFLA